VVDDERVTSFDAKRPSPGIYVTNDQSPAYLQGLVVRGAMDPAYLQKSIRKAVSDVNGQQALADVKTLEQLKSESLGDDRLRALLLAIFAAIALSLSVLGIYGVISYSVAQRTNEIGIRAALGATGGDLLGLVLRGGMLLLAAGFAIGLAGALGLARLLSTLLFGVGAWDALTLSAVACVLACAGLFACYVPARRAARVDPMVALRYE